MIKKLIFVLFILVVCTASVFAINDISDVNSFDRVFAKPYSKNLDNIGTVMQFAGMAAPGILVFEDFSRYPEIAVMYAETVGLTLITKEVIKNLVQRPRPYTYFDNAPEDKKEDWNKSMPSGHTAYAFAGASFASYVFCKYNPKSKYKIPVIATCSALAVSTAVLRVASGCHFVTDVLAGAAIGTAIGIGVPLLHTIGRTSGSSSIESGSPQISASPFGLAISLNF